MHKVHKVMQEAQLFPSSITQKAYFQLNRLKKEFQMIVDAIATNMEDTSDTDSDIKMNNL